MEDRIGTCSLCGGPVVVPAMMVYPTPHCRRCGAIPAVPQLPVIPMKRPQEGTRQPYMEDIWGYGTKHLRRVE